MPTIQTYPSLELWQAWDEVSLLGTHPVPWRIGPWWLGTDQQTDRALRNKERTEAARERIHPSCHSSRVQRLILGHTSCKHHQFLSHWVPVDFHGPLDVVGSVVVSLSSPTQHLGTAGGCCFRLVNHYEMLVKFCLSRGKKNNNKTQKEKV